MYAIMSVYKFRTAWIVVNRKPVRNESTPVINKRPVDPLLILFVTYRPVAVSR